MAEVSFGEGESLLVAARGTGPEHGLWRFVGGPGGWHGSQLATVGQLSSLCRHPTLPVVYGTGSVSGVILAWRIEGAVATPIGEALSGDDPCFVVIDPTGRLLVATNYGSSDLTLMPLAADGSFEGPPAKLLLEGGGPDAERQEAAHPHQALFHDGKLFVIDLGGDRIRSFTVDLDSHGASVPKPAGESHLPPGTGPRHGVFLPDGRLAISGELASTLAVSKDKTSAPWSIEPSTFCTGPAKTRTDRNYPGDIQPSADGAFVYLANRGHDTIAALDVRTERPRLAEEIDAGAAWPQHLLVHAGQLLIAGWDSGKVMVVPLGADGFAGPAEPLFDCPGPGWLMRYSG